MYTCKTCGKSFENRFSFLGHSSSHKRGEEYRKKRETDLSKEKRNKKQSEKKCKYCSGIFSNGYSLGAHVVHCNLNPNKPRTSERISKSLQGKKIPTDTKLKISKKMIIAHSEGRAWNIGKSRWNNEKSYPEIFFSNVIKNEFENKDYISEYPVGIFSIDFAWPSIKKAIEIDGDQHEKIEGYKDRDSRKDKFLNEKGWEVLRISWRDMFSRTKEMIEKAYDFIH